jgi:predicted nucleotidyltransferase
MRGCGAMSGVEGILLQKSKVASVRTFGETLKGEAIDDSDNLSRATEVACEFSMRR